MYTEETTHARIRNHTVEAVDMLRDRRGLHAGVDYYVEAVALQGSQNYGTNHEGSDVDTKMIVTPSYKSLLKGTKFNETLVLENGEHCDVKTGLDMISNICKGNINWIEGLYTKYTNHCDGTWWADMRNMRDSIVGAHRLKIMSAVYGMAQQKLASLYKPTGTTEPYFDKHGFDNKNFIHTMRLRDFAREFVKTQDFAHSMDYSVRGVEVMDFTKRGVYYSEQAEQMCINAISEMNTLYHHVSKAWEAPEVDFKQRLEDRYVEWVV